MSLIKRSVILYKDTTKGMLTVIRLGETIGAKLSLNEKPAGELWLGVKLGDGQQQNFKVINQITEFKPECDLCLNDSIGVILLNPDGTIFAYGGAREKVSASIIKETQTPEIAPIVAVEAVPNPVEKEKIAFKKAEPVPAPKAPPIQDRATVSTAKKVVRDNATKPETKRPAAPQSEAVHRPEPEVVLRPEPEFSAENEVDSRDWQPENETKKRNPFDIPKAKNFYQAVRGRLEEIMTINPKENELEGLIPDSEWVKVRYDGDEYYVVGRMYENNLVTYLGYGVPGVESVRPPKEAEELCDFLPLKNGIGYWLMFQKADDGSISKEIQ